MMVANGKLERWHQSLKRECIRPNSPVSLNDARRLVEKYVTEYNEVRLHSATVVVKKDVRKVRPLFACCRPWSSGVVPG